MAQIIPYPNNSIPANKSNTFFELLGVLIPPYKAIIDSVNLQDTLKKYSSNNPRLAQETFDYAITTRQITIPMLSENNSTTITTTTGADMVTLPTMPITQHDQFVQVNKDNQKYSQLSQQQYQQQRKINKSSIQEQQNSLQIQQTHNEQQSEQDQQKKQQLSTQGDQDIQDAWQSVELDENDEDIKAMFKITQKFMEIKRDFDGIKAAGQTSSFVSATSQNGSIATPLADLPGVNSFQSPNLLTNEEDTNIPENINYYQQQQQYQQQDGLLYYHSSQVPVQQNHANNTQSNGMYEQQFNYENDRLNYLKNNNQIYQRDQLFTDGTTTTTTALDEGYQHVYYQQQQLQQIDDNLDYQQQLPIAYNNNGQLIRIEGQMAIDYNDNNGELSDQQYELQQQLQQQLQQLSMIREEEEQESTLELHYFSGSGKYNPSRGSQMSSVQSNNTNSNNENNNSNNTNNNINGNYNGSTYGDNRNIGVPADATIDLPSEGSFEGQPQQYNNRKNNDILAKIAELDKKVKTALLKSEHK